MWLGRIRLASQLEQTVAGKTKITKTTFAHMQRGYYCCAMNRPAKTYTVSVDTLRSHGRALEQFLLERGDYHQLLATVGAQVEQLEAFEPEERVPIEVIAGNIDQVAGWVGEPNLGLKIAPLSSRLQPRLAFFFKQSALSLVDYLRMIARYACISTEAMNITIQQDASHLLMSITPNAPGRVSLHQTEGFVATVCDMLWQAFAIAPEAIDFSHGNPCPQEDTRVYADLLGVMPRFQQAQSRLYFTKTDGDSHYPEHTPSSISMDNIRAMEALHKSEIGIDSWAERCRFLLEILLCYGEPDKQALADLLAVSPRTLQRRLEDEGHSFRGLLRSLRMALAVKYITERSLSSEDIAFLLGYQDVGQYFKAFKSWFGMTPGAFRKQDT